jgi:hypothetical protein
MDQPEDIVVSNDDVGMSLTAGEETDAIVALLREELGDRLRVTDHATYLKLEAEKQLEIYFPAVAEALGRPFSLSDFQMIFSTYYGRPQVFEDCVGVYADMTVGVDDRG